MGEVENLRNASPATVSRAGIIFVSPTDLGWEPIVSTWLLKRQDLGSNRQAEADALQPVFDKWLKQAPPNAGAAQDLFDWCMRNIKKIMDANDSIVICNTLNLLSAIIKPCVDSNEIPEPSAYRRLLMYRVAWGFAGLCEDDERKKFTEKMV